MNLVSNANKLRAKILGAKIREKRRIANKSLEECASALNLQPGDLESCELGERAISLPELEILAYQLRTPIDYFYEKVPAADQPDESVQALPAGFIRLRQRMIGAMLRQARLETGISAEDMASQLNLKAPQLELYELGLEPIPLPVLEGMLGALNRSINDFQDKQGVIGQWNARQHAMVDFSNLPPDLQSFISKPANRPYLDLAVRLSEISVERLRGIAEGLLEITY
jgi:transcriptional regulator with XRE-family HTH domain